MMWADLNLDGTSQRLEVQEIAYKGIVLCATLLRPNLSTVVVDMKQVDSLSWRRK
jgi:hypothetical protein